MILDVPFGGHDTQLTLGTRRLRNLGLIVWAYIIRNLGVKGLASTTFDLETTHSNCLLGNVPPLSITINYRAYPGQRIIHNN